MYRLYINGLDIDLQHEEKEFLLEIISAIKKDEFKLESLEWVEIDSGLKQGYYQPPFEMR